MPRRPSTMDRPLPTTTEDEPLARRSVGTGTPPDRGNRGGRPTRERAEQLAATITAVATARFMSQGYGATSIEAICADAGISKRTFYSRFTDKPALFGAVIRAVVDRLRPRGAEPLVIGISLEDKLTHLAELIVRAAISPDALALHRLIIAESARFPVLAATIAEQGSAQEAVRIIAGVLEEERRAGGAVRGDTTFAAEHLLYMLLTIPQRRALGLGQPMTPADVGAWAKRTVRLFLDGACGPRA